MQFDLFDHSQDVMLRNAVVDALLRDDAVSAQKALAKLAEVYPDDFAIADLGGLSRGLQDRQSWPERLDTAEVAMRKQHLQSVLAPAARRILGHHADEWLRDFWRALARSRKGVAFETDYHELHPGALLLRSGDWEEVISAVEEIPSWRRKPWPLAWMLEAHCRSGRDEMLWVWLAELAWMSPDLACALVPGLESPDIEKRVCRFDAQFEGEGAGDDFAWFPAWVLIEDPALAADIRLVECVGGGRPERCLRLVLEALAHERQGRQHELLKCRKSLQATHAGLYDFYMKRR